jgi:hypothetical protein
VLIAGCGFASETGGHDAPILDPPGVDGAPSDGSVDGTMALACRTDPRYAAHSWSGIRYRFSSSARMWADAQSDCALDGGHLVVLDSGPENTYVDSLTAGELWIGYSDVAVEGLWVWITGEPTMFLNWRSDAPNNGADTGLGPQNCGEMDQGDVGTWNDDECNEINPYVCECP